MWGRRGVAIDPEGRVFMGTGDAPFVAETNSLGTALVSVKLDASKQLQFVDYFAPPNANWLFRRDLDLNVTPMAFDYRGRKFLVATSKECRLWLLDRDDLGGADNRTTLHTTPLLCNDAQAFDAKGIWGALAAWQDDKGRQWVIVPFYGPVSREFKAPMEHARPLNGGVAAHTPEERDGSGSSSLNGSRDMDMAEHAIVANGAFSLHVGSGEDTSQIVPTAFDDPAGAQIGERHQQCRRSTDSGIAARDTLRARRTDRARIVEQRQRDRVVESLQRPDDREWPRVHHDIRRHDLRLRRTAVREPAMRTAHNYLLTAMCVLASAAGWAQGRNIGFDWPATSADAQRTAASPRPEHLGGEFVEAGLRVLRREKLTTRSPVRLCSARA
jgi:hypothetical protein